MFYFETWNFDGALNMAIDVSMGLYSLEVGEPFLRFYSWKTPTLSLGKNQDVQIVNFKYINERGFDCVRRPTGGRAVFHSHEITYSITIPRTHPLYKKSVLNLYKEISQIIVEGLRNCGYPVALTTRGSRGNSASCFDSPSWYEVTLMGKKVIGSAQLRKKEYILQHGSIILKTSTEIKNCVLNVPDNIIQTGLFDFKKVNINTIKENIINAFTKKFDIKKIKIPEKLLISAVEERMRYNCLLGNCT
ncbi:lipoate--protein ligase family protein [Thermosipho ferrireducens]|uniref:Lipoate--protein ligase family protein n=1 Tax=Thermosipho ferrireducens TaxID=2571116 RepID=A0ABX7S602_9BACT|nr:biotin/lipoate A/B protein ligase family protein [Thermosipho ferrireducens]QTA37160.1 lipoate--protein ligase family protein [Thermosipho ferrireducens]